MDKHIHSLLVQGLFLAVSYMMADASLEHFEHRIRVEGSGESLGTGRTSNYLKHWPIKRSMRQSQDPEIARTSGA